ncbi:MAG: NADH-quinone oxidoreductase subunit A [Planctomycetes bacterium]|nr:NADH-quinone oxidoreductase subunit A [Planctomycetota bacterium]
MREPDLNDYLPVLLMLGWGVVFAVGALGASWLLGEKGKKSKYKDRPYECGMPIQSEAHARFGVKFYLVAVLFILFDVEVVFMYPWAVSFGSTTVRGDAPSTALLMWEILAFVVILFLGWAYVIKKGVLEWHKED